MKYDFSGWATKNNMKCSDGLTIMKDAFKDNDGAKVPLVWNHSHNDPNNVLGHAMLENKQDGVYAYCVFNNTPSAQNAKEMVAHGDIDQLSIYANKLKKSGNAVMHGDIKEVSLVLAGANPGACIEEVMCHGELIEDMGIIFTGENISSSEGEYVEHADDGGKTIQEIYDSMSEEQQKVVEALVGAAVAEEQEKYSKGGNVEMKHNVFEGQNQNEVLSHGIRKSDGEYLAHDELQTIFQDMRRYGSLKDSFLQHGVEEIEQLFPDPTNLDTPPQWIKREMGWVDKIMKGVHHTPFSRIKSMFADITGDEARALGYIKGNLKKEQVFSLLKRTTSPTTIYKKQKFDRDDLIDLTSFDFIGWIKSEMRFMLNEEIARAILVGDGRLASSDDHINTDCIRPIYTDQALFTIKKQVNVYGLSDDAKIKEFMKAAVRARKDYKGSGSPSLFTTEDLLTEMLLLEDKDGHLLFDSVEKIKNYLRVSDIVTVPVMEGIKRNETGVDYDLQAIIVNLNDYNVGADKGGAVSMFDDFDIDYNQQKYLIETRCSGALVKPYSAIVIESYSKQS